jgi:hypothetical protein
MEAPFFTKLLFTVYPSSFADPQKTTSPVSWATTMMSLLATMQ